MTGNVQASRFGARDNRQEAFPRKHRADLDEIDSFVGQFVYDGSVSNSGRRRAINVLAASKDARYIAVLFTKLTELTWQQPLRIANSNDAVSDEQRKEHVQFSLIINVRMHIPETGNDILCPSIDYSCLRWNWNILCRADGRDALTFDDDCTVVNSRPVSHVNERGASHHEGGRCRRPITTYGKRN